MHQYEVFTAWPVQRRPGLVVQHTQVMELLSRPHAFPESRAEPPAGTQRKPEIEAIWRIFLWSKGRRVCNRIIARRRMRSCTGLSSEIMAAQLLTSVWQTEHSWPRSLRTSPCLLTSHCQGITHLEGRPGGHNVGPETTETWTRRAPACSRLQCTRHMRWISRAAWKRLLRQVTVMLLLPISSVFLHCVSSLLHLLLDLKPLRVCVVVWESEREG